MRVNYQVVTSGKDPRPLLDSWKGGQVVLWGFAPSHRVLELRVFHSEKKNRLRIYCAEVSTISLPTKWTNSDIVVSIVSENVSILSDARAGVEIKAEVVACDEVTD